MRVQDDHAPLVGRFTPAVILLAALAAIASAVPFISTSGPGPTEYLSVRGEMVTLYGFGPYRHMPADVAIQGLAQDLVTLVFAVPLLLVTLLGRRSTGARLVLTGIVAYLLVQYLLYLTMGTYNELFLVWTATLLVASQVLARLVLLPVPPVAPAREARVYAGSFLIVAGALMATLWLSVLVPPLLDASLYPTGLYHLTTMVVQGLDLALFIPPALIGGYWYLRNDRRGDMLAPAYAVFLSLQMLALLAKIAWMAVSGTSAGPALAIVPALLLGALLAAYLTLRPYFQFRDGQAADAADAAELADRRASYDTTSTRS